MRSLDDHGKLGAAVIPFYLPIFVASAVVVLRHGFGRNTGWVYLFVFSIIRILGGALLVAAELVQPVNINLYIAASVLQAAGLSPLLLATLGFVRTVVTNAYREDVMMTRGFRLLYLLGTAAFVISIYGGTQAVSDNPGTLKTSTTLRHVGSILFAVLYILLVVVHIMCWMVVSRLARYRRLMLTGISLALPFLGVRMAYSVVSSFSGSPIASTSGTPSSLSRFNQTTGTWWIYLIMALLMEYVVVVTYTVVGLMTPNQKTDGLDDSGQASSRIDALEMGKQPGSYQSSGYAAPYRVQ